MSKDKINKLDINLFGNIYGKSLEEHYNSRRAEFIAGFKKYIPGYSRGFWGGWVDGYYEQDPNVGEAEWNKIYPMGIESFKSDFAELNSIGQQRVVDKINEIINFINK